MKKIINLSIASILSLCIVTSCADDSLDPMRQKEIKKASMLALRGEDDRSFDPTAFSSADAFKYTGEFLSDDPTSLESMDIYVVKKKKVVDQNSATGFSIVDDSRILVKNIPFSAFNTSGTDYPRPYVSVSIPLSEIMSKLGLDLTNSTDLATLYDLYTFYDATINAYNGGPRMETDINLVGGKKVFASSLASQGLYAYPTFNPAQILTYYVIRN